jgi:hypothetical protein
MKNFTMASKQTDVFFGITLFFFKMVAPATKPSLGTNKQSLVINFRKSLWFISYFRINLSFK